VRRAIYWANIGRVVYALSESKLLEITGANAENPTLSLPCREVFAGTAAHRSARPASGRGVREAPRRILALRRGVQPENRIAAGDCLGVIRFTELKSKVYWKSPVRSAWAISASTVTSISLQREPWLEAIELQDSAYPYHDWNERITAECYATNAAARILDNADASSKS